MLVVRINSHRPPGTGAPITVDFRDTIGTHGGKLNNGPILRRPNFLDPNFLHMDRLGSGV